MMQSFAQVRTPISLPMHPRSPTIRVGAASFTAAPTAAPTVRRAPTEQIITLRDGRRLGFAEYGDPNGEPVLEFHGWPSCRLEALVYDQPGEKVGARIIAIDRPGVGLSTYKKGYRLIDWPSDVFEFANALGLERFAVVGTSSGSAPALACARFIPERLLGCAIVGGMPPLKVEGENLKPQRYIDPLEVMIARMANTVPPLAQAAFWYISRLIRTNPDKALKQFMKGAPPSEFELLKDERHTRNYQMAIAECSRHGTKGMIDWLGLELREWGFRLQDIAMNVSLWQGERDVWAFPSAARYMASKLPNHTLHFIPDVGHLAVLVHHAEDVLRELLSAK